ncbi:DUF3108 domain-containing protein [bacterium]|nr:DUF3108 domain-containing protein [bacterium]
MKRLVLALLLVPLLPGPTSATGVTLEYDVLYGPLQVMTLRSTARFAPAGYETSTQVRTVGLAGVLFPWTADANTVGRRGDGGLLPLRHRAHGEYRGSERSVALDYGADGAVQAVIAPPPEADDRQPVPDAERRATIDPLTATLTAVQDGCRGILRVFDGRRRYDLALADQGESELPAATPAYRGRAQHCQAQVTPRTGFWQATAQHDERPAQLDVWIAAPTPDVMRVPVYMRLSGARGTLGFRLSAATPLP